MCWCRVWRKISHSVLPTNSGPMLRHLMRQLYDISELNIFRFMLITVCQKSGGNPLVEKLLIKFKKVVPNVDEIDPRYRRQLKHVIRSVCENFT